jgi:Carboxypeptidase regulatory-like domain/TonB dependent receptor
MRKPLRLLYVSMFVLLLAALPAMAQTNKATITGTVTDPGGAVVAGATVTVTNVNTGIERKVTTSDDGTYIVPLLDIGTYRVAVNATGFKEVVRDNLTLQTNDRLPVDVQLTTATTSGEVVNITAEAPIVQTETSDRGSVITGREVTELPLSGRNFTQLATLVPGVARSANTGFGGTGPDARQFNNGDPRAGDGGPGSSNAQGATETSRFARSGGGTLTVNGQRPTNNNFSLDGVDNNEPQFGTIGVFPNPDAIAEFKVSTSIPAAEVGRASGAVINTTIKSGTNDMHGSLYYYGQNSALNAFHPMLKRDRANAIARGDRFIPDKAVQQIHEFGGTVGGPIIKSRTFYFFDYLGQRNNLPFPATSTVPTVLSREGDFSEFPTILNPYTGQPFPGNRIPGNLIDPVAQRIFKLYPLPTANVLNPGQNNNNYFTQRANQEHINNFEGKIDHKVSDNNSITGRFNEQRLQTVRANLLAGLPTAGFGAGEENGNTRQLTISDTHTFSPHLLNEFRFGFTQINIAIFNCGVNGACGTSATFANDVGVPNVNDGSLEQSGGPGLGNFGTGFTEFLGDGGLFQVKSKNPYFADSLTILKGSHAFKAGAEVRLRYLNTIDGGRSGFLKGNIQYADAGPTSNALLPGQVCPAASRDANGTKCFVDKNGVPYGGTGNAQANQLMSLPAFQVSRGRVFGGPFNLRTQELGFFVQDDWKVNSRLTLNLGLRYDIFTPPTEADARVSYYDPAQRIVDVASSPHDRIVKTDKNNFGPRIGFAYALTEDKKLVLRGGYGLLYTLDGTDYPPAIRNPPFTNSFNIAQFTQDPANRTYFSVKTGPPSVTTQVDPTNLPNGVALYTVDFKQKTGYVHQGQLSLQYQFARNWSIDVGYVVNRANNLLTTFDIGSGGTGIARNRVGDALGNVLLYTNVADSSYDGLQIQVQKRLSRNFQGQVSYTWSHTIDNGIGVVNSLGDSRNGGRSGPTDPLDLDVDRGNSSLDIRHLLSASAIIDLPFGKGQRFLNHGGPANAILGGWQLNLIESARSGFPFTVVCNCGAVRPTLVGDPFSNVPAGRFLNPAAFSVDPTRLVSVKNAAGNTISFGTLGRNTFTGPNIYNTDLSLFKNTALTERWKLQIGIEFYNAFNHTNLTVPNTNFTDVGTDGLGHPTGFGVFNGAYPGRVVQYRAKLLF